VRASCGCKASGEDALLLCGNGRMHDTLSAAKDRRASPGARGAVRILGRFESAPEASRILWGGGAGRGGGSLGHDRTTWSDQSAVGLRAGGMLARGLQVLVISPCLAMDKVIVAALRLCRVMNTAEN
jgi:hypothetical protein